MYVMCFGVRVYLRFLQMPGTPRREHEIVEHPDHRQPQYPPPTARVKILRKEREGELYIMVFNAIRQMYRRLYEQRFIGGAAMLSLGNVLDLSIDFAIGKLKKNPIKVTRYFSFEE